MAIVIIAVLIALLLPAIQSVRNTARIAQIRTDITALESAIADFKAARGVEPPSSIVLYEAAEGSAVMRNWGVDAMGENDRLRSRALIRMMWPDFDFAFVDTSIPMSTGRDFNGDNDTNDVHVLNGSECLVFFLGGIFEGGAPTGFSKNPSNPFATGGSREGPFAEFNVGRLVDTNGNVAREYLDTVSGQTAPFVYVSSYDGQGYNWAELPAGMIDVYRESTAAPWIAGNTYASGALVVPAAPTALVPGVHYRAEVVTAPGTAGTTQPIWPAIGGTPVTDGQLRWHAEAAPAWKAKSFQIISPGFDGQYGTGGPFQTDVAEQQLSPAVNRLEDRDNVTNFFNGRLAP